MILDQIIAKLNIVDTIVHNIEVNARMVGISDANQKEFGLDIKCSKPIVKDDVKLGRLLLQVNVSVKHEEDSEKQDTFHLTMEGVFSSDASVEDNEFLSLLNINGGAALYSIARAKLEMISGITYSNGKILLPMINMVQYYQERNDSKN